MSHTPHHLPAHGCTPVLRLRPNAEQSKVKLRKLLDGAYIRHPDEIEEDVSKPSRAEFKLDISVENYRVAKNRGRDDLLQSIRVVQKEMTKSEKADMFEVLHIVVTPQLVDLRLLQTSTDEVIERAIEAHFVHCSVYDNSLAPDHEEGHADL
jgi:hypothetical protein